MLIGLLLLRVALRAHAAWAFGAALLGLALRRCDHQLLLHGAGLPPPGQCSRGGKDLKAIEDLQSHAAHSLHPKGTLFERVEEAHDDVRECAPYIGLVLPLLLHCHDVMGNDLSRTAPPSNTRVGTGGCMD